MRSAASAIASARRTPNAASTSPARHESGRSAGAVPCTSEERVNERRHARDLADENQHADEQQHHDEGNQPEALAPPQEAKELIDRAGSARDISQDFHDPTV